MSSLHSFADAEAIWLRFRSAIANRAIVLRFEIFAIGILRLWHLRTTYPVLSIRYSLGGSHREKEAHDNKVSGLDVVLGHPGAKPKTWDIQATSLPPPLKTLCAHKVSQELQQIGTGAQVEAVSFWRRGPLSVAC